MADPSQHQSPPSRHWWTHLLRWLWRGFGLLWGLIIVGVVVNVASTRLTSDQGFPPDSPVGLAIRNLPLTIAVGVILLLLTLLVGLLHRQSTAHSSQAASPLPLPPQQSRDTLIRTLSQEYTRRLTHSLQGAAMMVLGLHERTDLTISSAQLVFRHTTIVGEHPLPPGTSIAQAYDDAGQGLLILGEPGAGKTTLLLDLARELLTRAQGDPLQPIPVIVNLSSWATKQPPLANWLIDQLQLVYQLPSRLGQAWLEHDQWLLLLDGLDEVEVSARSACIEAINTYRGEHFVPLVVCSRSLEYTAQEARLALPGAVVVQPLQEQEVVDYLKRVGKPLMAVRAALRTNPILQQLITTPLMLNVIILAYRDKTAKDLPQMGTLEEQQQQIFERYVGRMLEQRAVKSMFSPQQMRKWLIWLAQRMQQHHLTEFYLEGLQPESLPTPSLRIIYWLLAGLVVGLPFGLVYGLLGGLLGGLLSGLLFGLAFEPGKIRPAEVLSWSWKYFWWTLFVGPFAGLLAGLLGELRAGPRVGLFFGVFVGLALGPPAGLFFGLSNEQIAEHLHINPNEGILRSGRNGLRIGFVITLIFGFPLGLSIWLGTSSLFGPLAGPLFGLTFGLFSGLRRGGDAYLWHYILRSIFWRIGVMPWHYAHFLDEAAERILLQKVGGGYRFIHPLFLDYFASQGITTANVPEQSSSQKP